jgi:hypothetical protein
MENQLIKIIDRLPDGIVRQFLKRNAKYSTAVAILAAGYFVTSVSVQESCDLTMHKVTDARIRGFIEFILAR